MLSRNVVLQGRYKIIRQLGQGGMGAVYEAEDIKRFGKEVALKEILIDLARISNPNQQELIRHAFEREAKILTQVDHEAFPQVVDYFTEDEAQFLVMELIQGQDLGELLRTRKAPFSVSEIIDWTDQLLDALDYLHTLDPPIIHRDIKPQNLKLTSRGKVKLLDFGIAKGADKQVNTTIATQTFIAATLNYSPFEQILRVLDSTFREALMPLYGDKIEYVLEQPADPRSDIYALGATLYHLLTNQVPLDALKRALAVWGGKPDALVKPIEINPDIPPAISDWLMKSMEIEWENRFVSAIAMQKAFREAVHSEKRIEEETKNLAWLKEQEDLKRERLLIEQERKKMEEERQRHILQIEEERNRQSSTYSIPNAQTGNINADQPLPNVPDTQISFSNLPPAPTLLLSKEAPAPTLLLNKDEIGVTEDVKISDLANSSPVTVLEISQPQTSNTDPSNSVTSQLSRISYLPEELKSPEPVAAIPPVVQNNVSPATKQSSPIIWILPIAAVILVGAVFGIYLIGRSFLGENSVPTATNSTPTTKSNVAQTTPIPSVSPSSTPIESSIAESTPTTTKSGSKQQPTPQKEVVKTAPAQRDEEVQQPAPKPRTESTAKKPNPNPKPTVDIDKIIKP